MPSFGLALGIDCGSKRVLKSTGRYQVNRIDSKILESVRNTIPVHFLFCLIRDFWRDVHGFLVDSGIVFLDYSEWILRVLLLDPGIIFDCFGIDFAQMLVQCCRDSAQPVSFDISIAFFFYSPCRLIACRS